MAFSVTLSDDLKKRILFNVTTLTSKEFILNAEDISFKATIDFLVTVAEHSTYAKYFILTECQLLTRLLQTNPDGELAEHILMILPAVYRLLDTLTPKAPADLAMPLLNKHEFNCLLGLIYIEPLDAHAKRPFLHFFGRLSSVEPHTSFYHDPTLMQALVFELLRTSDSYLGYIIFCMSRHPEYKALMVNAGMPLALTDWLLSMEDDHISQNTALQALGALCESPEAPFTPPDVLIDVALALVADHPHAVIVLLTNLAANAANRFMIQAKIVSNHHSIANFALIVPPTPSLQKLLAYFKPPAGDGDERPASLATTLLAAAATVDTPNAADMSGIAPPGDSH